MPEYLAPGVYVEEVDTGSKPIEGVSTSTSGIVGVAERGPLDVPVLVTSSGDYVRWFGGQLDPLAFAGHQYLPHAVDGFFTNGGKRAYVVRVAGDGATRAASPLFHAGAVSSTPTVLVRPAGEGTGTAATPPALVVLGGSNLAESDWVRVGDGSGAEFRRLAADPDADATLVPLALPLARSHDAGTPVAEYARAVLADAFTTAGAADAGDTQVVVEGDHADVAALVANLAGDTVRYVEIGTDAGLDVAEYRRVTTWTGPTISSATTSTLRLGLDAPLDLPWPAGVVVSQVDLSAAAVHDTTVALATAGSGLLFVDDRDGNLDTRSNLVVVDDGPGGELRRLGALHELDVVLPAGRHDVGDLVQAVGFPADRALASATGAVLTLGAGQTEGLVPGQRIVLDPGGSPENLTVVAITGDDVTVTPAPTATSVGLTVVPIAKTTTAAALAGAKVIALDDRLGLAEGDVVRVGTGATAQHVTIQSLPALTGVAPDAGNVVVWPGLVAAAPQGTEIGLPGTPSPVAGRQTTSIAVASVAGEDSLYVTDGSAFAAGETIRVVAGPRATYYRLAQAASAADVEALTLEASPLARSHPAGSVVIGREPLVTVQALDPGAWGNRLRVSVENEPTGLVASTTLVTPVVDATTIRLASPAGVQAGTVLELFDPATGVSLGDPVKVDAIDRAAGTITLAGTGLTAAQQLPGAVVRSREFRLTVRLLRQPDPAVPSRDQQPIDVEVFRHLSLDSRHSGYIERVVGAIDGTLRKWDHRPEGSSLYVRVRDLGDDVARHAVRLGPETLVDLLPDGRRVPAQLRLEDVSGSDALSSVTDGTYLGQDNADPDLRTGLQSLRNVEDVSLVAIPGQAGAALQQGVIDHCELMRYRFAVLDSTPEPNDTIADAQTQRQQFDTKYASLYYPWLSIPEPFPANLADVHDYAIPPSGHVLGVFARTDVTRGVHKAPANEVVQGITGLRRKVNRAEHDILNPYPTNINVIRDFREDSRGIRVYGGRVLTSDPDWKYVNVRRLLIFIEASLDRGLQWVVFEPNADPLWARVRRVVSNFLTTVWRSGALEGTKVEEAFFVRCDRTTMTQTDIDNGRLIVQIGVAPVKPAEFVILRIGLWTAHADT